jgi:hypothetical protein
MKRHPRTVRTAGLSRDSYAGPAWAYVLFFGVAMAAVAALTVASFYLPPRALPGSEVQFVEFPVAKIQLTANREGMCRHLLFHNDTGRFEDDGTGKCHGLIAEELLVNSISTNRVEALARVFKLR